MSQRVVAVKLTAQVSDFEKGMLDAARATRTVGTEAEKLEQKKQAFERLGQGLVLTGSALTAVTALSVKAALDWESAWAGVTKTVDGNEQQMAELEDGLRSLAQTLPATHQEIAAVAEAAGQLGVAREDVVGFTKTMIDLSETTNLSADEAATSIAQLMNVMQTAPEDVDNLGSALVALGNDGASTERDIIQMAQRIAGAGKVVGLTEPQVLGFANALASVGIEAEAGGSAISRIMTDIAMSVSSGGEKLDEFAKVAGMSSADFQKAFKEAPADAIATFVEGLGRIDAQGGDVFQTLSNLGQSDIRVSQALLGMANSGDLLRESLQLGSEAWDENAALAEEAGKRYETTEAKIQVAGNAVRDAAIDFGQVFLPAVAGAADAVAAFSGFMTDLPDPVQGVIAILTSTIGAVSLLGGGALLAVPKIAELKIALETLNITGASSKAALSSMWQFLTGPYGVAMVAATAAVVGLSVAQEKLRTSTEVFQNVLKNAKSADELFEAGDSAVPFLSRLSEATSSAKVFKENLDIIANNDFLRGLRGETSQLSAVLTTMGEEMGKLAQTDAPAAARSFKLLSDEMELSKSEQIDLLNAMKPYRDELVKLADAQDRDVTTKDGQIDMTELLAFAMEDSADAAQTAAEEYMTEADAVGDLSGQLSQLIDKINEANGVGQDAVTTNAQYQSALAGLAEQVEKNGASLDQATEAGSANAASLADVARRAQDAAAAQFEQDKATMSSKDAADKYYATLQNQRQAFIDSAAAAGFNKDEVIKLADQVFKLPSETEIKVIAETDTAEDKLRRLKERLDAIPNNSYKRVTLESFSVGKFDVSPNAAGGYYERGVKAFAGGGFEPGIYPYTPGGIHKFAEEAPEGYVSMDPARRVKSEGVWQTIGDRMGFTQSSSQSAAPTQIEVVVSPKGGIDLLQYVDVRVQERGRDVASTLKHRRRDDA